MGRAAPSLLWKGHADQGHALEMPAGNEHLDSHQGAGSACAGNAMLQS